MRAKLFSFIAVSSMFFLLSLAGCSTTQKTAGEGLSSVVAQSVVRIAGLRAMHDADLSALKGKSTHVDLTGFIDDKNKSYLESLIKSKVEAAGGRITDGKAAMTLEVLVNSPGNDMGAASKVPLITRSERTGGTIDLDLTIRRSGGAKVKTEHVHGESKYEQTAILGIEGQGKYFVKGSGGEYTEVPNPSTYE
jgi:hypothetical protein